MNMNEKHSYFLMRGKILCKFQNKRKIFEGFHSFGRKKFLFDEILNTNPVFPEIWGKIFFS